MTRQRQPRIACIGVTDWDRLIAIDVYPEPGGVAHVTQEISALGGPTTNTAVALARLGAEVRLAAAVGDDERGAKVQQALEAAGIDTKWIAVKPGQTTSQATVIVSREPLDRTIILEHGTQLARRDQLDIESLLGGDVLVLDVPDVSLRRFLLDLPAHTVPTCRILGPLNYLADINLTDGFELALRHDAIVSNERDMMTMTGTWTIADAMTALQNRMAGQTLRAAFITRAAEGSLVVTETERLRLPAFRVDAVDPTGAGDAFVAGVAWGMAQRWSWADIGRFANAVGALACRSLGAQTSLPSLAEVEALLASQSTRVD